MTPVAPLLVLVNPAAGGGRGSRTAARAVAALELVGVRTEVVSTVDAEDLRVRARAAAFAGAPRVAVVGGDGSVRVVAAALSGSVTQLALIPCGRGNDLARALGVSRHPEFAAAIAVSGTPRLIDLGSVAGEPFATIATFGFDAAVARLVHRRGVPGRGLIAYGLAVARTLLSYQPIPATLSGDFGTREGRFFLVASANTRSYGAGIRMAPHATPDDGLLDVCVVGDVGLGKVLTLLPRLARGRHVGDAAVSVLRTRSLRIECEPGEPIYADGEPMASAPVTIAVLPKALNVVVPRA